MEDTTYQIFTQLGAAFTVVVSLAMVAYELKQSRDVAKAELTLSVYQAEANQYLTILDQDAYRSAVYKTEVSGDELTWDEKKNLSRVFIAYNGITASKYQLWKLGLLTDGEWEWELEKVKGNLAESELWHDAMFQGNYRNPHFLQVMDGVKAEFEAERAASLD